MEQGSSFSSSSSSSSEEDQKTDNKETYFGGLKIPFLEAHDHNKDTCVFRTYPLNCKYEEITSKLETISEPQEWWDMEFMIPKLGCTISLFFKRCNSRRIFKKLEDGLDLIAEQMNKIDIDSKFLNLKDFDTFTKTCFELIRCINIKSSSKDIYNLIQDQTYLPPVSNSVVFTQLNYKRSKTEISSKDSLTYWKCVLVSCSFDNQVSFCEHSQEHFETLWDIKVPLPNNIKFNPKTCSFLEKTLSFFNPDIQNWRLINPFLRPEDSEEKDTCYLISFPSTQTLLQVLEVFQIMFISITQGIIPKGTKINNFVLSFYNSPGPVMVESIGVDYEQGFIFFYMPYQ